MIGNAVSLTSFSYIESYLNDSDTHILLKSAALEALSRFHHAEVFRDRPFSLLLRDHLLPPPPPPSFILLRGHCKFSNICKIRTMFLSEHCSYQGGGMASCSDVWTFLSCYIICFITTPWFSNCFAFSSRVVQGWVKAIKLRTIFSLLGHLKVWDSPLRVNKHWAQFLHDMILYSNLYV